MTGNVSEYYGSVLYDRSRSSAERVTVLQSATEALSPGTSLFKLESNHGGCFCSE